mmetsp:Transcript_81825/g.265205  ORF Transcript_81825/g.265205 Transcript_81825/m.265205 type:complete len:241 (+) Transcript_81825:3-725(+)
MGPPSAPQTVPLRGTSPPFTSTVLNVPATSRPATWLCSGGKISGTPLRSLASAAVPTTKMAMQRPVAASTTAGHLDSEATNLRRHASLSARRSWSSAWASGREGGSTTARLWSWPQEMSTTRSLTLSRRLSRTTSSGGRKQRTSVKALSTQRPMKTPNSRSGCTTLARLAKKLTEVVKEVAKQALPARAMSKARRAPMSLCSALRSQESVKTKTTSLPTPMMRKTDKKETTVTFAAGVST